MLCGIIHDVNHRQTFMVILIVSRVYSLGLRTLDYIIKQIGINKLDLIAKIIGKEYKL